MHKKSEAVLNGLILSGGRSRRMGEDKGAIKYHDDLAHREYLAKLIQPFCNETYISCRVDQKIKSSFKLIEDVLEDIGPLAGILSAFGTSSDSAWLTVACDYPNLDTATIDTLISNRKSEKIATCFFNEARNCPEPLLTIWEPSAYSILKDKVEKGFLSPLRILQGADIALVQIPDLNKIFNANDPKQKEMIQ